MNGIALKQNTNSIYRYIVRDLLGQGTFGQVFRCEDTQMGNKQVAVKIIKNKRAYVRQATMEKKVLQHVWLFFDSRLNLCSCKRNLILMISITLFEC